MCIRKLNEPHRILISCVGLLEKRSERDRKRDTPFSVNRKRRSLPRRCLIPVDTRGKIIFIVRLHFFPSSLHACIFVSFTAGRTVPSTELLKKKKKTHIHIQKRTSEQERIWESSLAITSVIPDHGFHSFLYFQRKFRN